MHLLRQQKTESHKCCPIPHDLATLVEEVRHFEGYPSPRGLEELLDPPHLPKTPHSFQSPNVQLLGKMVAFCLVDMERDALSIIVQLDSFSQAGCVG